MRVMDVTMYSDGSSRSPIKKGGGKREGACAAVVRWDGDKFPTKVACSGEFTTSIGRMELLGVITGMRYIHWLASRAGLSMKDIRLSAFVDSMFVFKAAVGACRRLSNHELWDMFDELGSLFGAVSIEHRPRNTLELMEEADRAAGMARRAIADGALRDMVTEKSYVVIDVGETIQGKNTH